MRFVRGTFAGAIIGLLALLEACGDKPTRPEPNPAAIPATLSAGGDPAQGEVVFQASGCTSCHNTSQEKLVGPGLAGLFSAGGPTLPDGVDYAGNLPNGQPRSEEAIAAWIRSGGEGKIGVMPAQSVSDADMAHLLAYLRTLQK